MGDQPACSPCVLDVLMMLPPADGELPGLGLPALSPSQRAPHAAPAQPSPGPRTPDMAMFDFPISEEEMEWLVALADGDAPAPLNHSTSAAAAEVAAAETASASTTVTAPVPQHYNHLMDPGDQGVLRAHSSGLTASQAEAAAGAVEFGNNIAWVAEAAATSAGSMVPLLGDTMLLQELRLWSGEIQSGLKSSIAPHAAPFHGQQHTPDSSGTSSRGQRSGKPRRSPQSSLKRRGRRPAIQSAFQRDIELFTLRVQEEEATAQRCPAPPPPPPQPALQQPHQPRPATPCTDGLQQQGAYAAAPATSAVTAPAPVHQTLTALLASCLGARAPQAAGMQACKPAAGGPAAGGTVCAGAGGTAPVQALPAAEAVQVPGGTEVLVQVVDYQLEDCRDDSVLKLEGASANNVCLGM